MSRWSRLIIVGALFFLWAYALRHPGLSNSIVGMAPWLCCLLPLFSAKRSLIILVPWIAGTVLLIILAGILTFVTAMVPYHTPKVMDWIAGTLCALVLLFLLGLMWTRLGVRQRWLLGAWSLAAYPITVWSIQVQFTHGEGVGFWGADVSWFSCTTATLVTIVTVGLIVVFPPFGRDQVANT